MSALALIEQARREFPGTVAILMSGNLAEDEVRQVEALQVFGTLNKPCSGAEMVDLVNRAWDEWLCRGAATQKK